MRFWGSILNERFPEQPSPAADVDGGSTGTGATQTDPWTVWARDTGDSRNAIETAIAVVFNVPPSSMYYHAPDHLERTAEA